MLVRAWPRALHVLCRSWCDSGRWVGPSSHTTAGVTPLSDGLSTRRDWSRGPTIIFFLDLGEDLLQDDPPPGDELPAGPVAATGRQSRAERIRAGVGRIIGSIRPGEPIRRRDLLWAPADDLRRQSVLPAVAQDQALGVGDLLAAPAQELPPVRRRVLVRRLAGRRLPGVAPIRPGRRPGRGMPFRVASTLLLAISARFCVRRLELACDRVESAE